MYPSQKEFRFLSLARGFHEIGTGRSYGLAPKRVNTQHNSSGTANDASGLRATTKELLESASSAALLFRRC